MSSIRWIALRVWNATLARALWSSLTLAALACSCSKDEASKPAANGVRVVGTNEPPAEIGQRIENGVFEMSVERVKPCTVEPHFRPPPGVRKVGVEISLKAVGQAEVPANVFYGLLIAADGERYEATLAGCQPVLEAKRLGSGESTSGWITFDVPESVTQAQFRYAPVVIGAGRPHLVFELGSLVSAAPP